MDTTTFVHVLRMHAKDLQNGNELPGDELARIVQRITEMEIEEGGPYAEVFGNDRIERGDKIDLGLNLAIALFLGSFGISLPKLDGYIVECLESGFKKMHSDILSVKEFEEYVTAYKAIKIENAESHISYELRVPNTAEENMIALIWKAAHERFARLSPEMQQRAKFVMDRTIKGNPDRQMSLMPYYLREALGSKGKAFSDECISQLGLANVFFWTAFIVYDDFWDVDEAADPQLLPVANLFARHYTDYFSGLLPIESGFREFFHTMMDELDVSNEWETSNCRVHVDQENGVRIQLPETLPEYGNYERKFYPAAGHIMGPVAMLLQCGFAIDSLEVKSLTTYFKEYLIAMQLNDDAHDWKEDLRRGHLSTAVTELLRIWCEKYPDSKEIDFEADMPELEQLFWFELLEPFCEVILSHTVAARAALQELSFLEDTAPLEKFILKNEDAAYRAIQDRMWSGEFLSAFAAVDKG